MAFFGAPMPAPVHAIDLATFRRDSAFYGTLDLLVTIKSFDLQAIRARYLASRANRSGRAGSVERRTPSPGGVARVRLREGRCESEVLARMTEPRGIDARMQRDGRMHAAIAAEDRVHWFAPEARGTLTHPWFAYLHTVAYHPEDADRVVVSSSGYDWIGEFALGRGEALWTWLAWEHGFNRGRDPETGGELRLTRRPEEARALEADGHPVLLVSDPPREAIPTARRAAFINSVTYDAADPRALLATFFHEGAVYRIGRDGSAERLLDGLRNPHGGRRMGPAVMATSTAGGQIVHRDATGEQRWSLGHLPGKPEALGEAEWIQNTAAVDGWLVAIDANRTAFAIIDPAGERLDLVPFPEDWAVQDLVAAPPSPGLDAWVRGLGMD
jgi:hypothetical protein